MQRARAPPAVCGAATLGHLHVPSRQHTLPLANDAGIHQAEKKEKTAHRILLSLDNRGPHKCSARIHATLDTGNAPRDEAPATRKPAAAMSVAISRAASCLEQLPYAPMISVP